LNIKRLSTEEKNHEVGLIQMIHILKDNKSPFSDSLCVLTTDSLYNVLENHKRELPDNLIWLSRGKNNRNFYAPNCDEKSHKKYGVKMKLNDPSTHLIPDEKGSFITINAKEKVYKLSFQRWNGLLIRGTRSWKGYEHPFDVIQYTKRI